MVVGEDGEHQLESLRALQAALYVPVAPRGGRSDRSAAAKDVVGPGGEVVRNPSAWRPIDLRLRACTDWCEVTGPENPERILPDSQEWSYWDDLVRVQENVPSQMDTKGRATAFKQVVMWRLLYDPVLRWGDVYQHDQCLCYKRAPSALPLLCSPAVSLLHTFESCSLPWMQRKWACTLIGVLL
jgi:hypothetical protein